MSSGNPRPSADLKLRALLLCSAVVMPSVAMAQDATSQPSVALDTVVITASGFEQSVRDTPASVSVITSEDLEKGSFTNLSDALREVTGVVTTGSANEEDIFIRGLPGQYTLILVDGKRQSTRESRTNGNAGYEQSFIPPVSAIERIEVVRGPMSSLYGSDAMGGVINIITKPVADEWSGSVTAEATLQGEDGFENSQQLSFYASGPVIRDQLSLQLWGRKLDQDPSDIEAGPAGSDDFDLTGRLTWALDAQNEFRFEAGRTRLKSEELGGESWRNHDRNHWSLSHKGSYGETDTEVAIYQEVGERVSFGPDDDSGLIVEDPRSPEVTNTTIDAKASTPLDWNGAHRLTFGAQYTKASIRDQNPGQQAELDPADRYDQTFSNWQWALFVEDEWRVRDDFALTLGLRYSDHEIYGGHITPRIYGVWDATDQLTVKGGISTGFRAPDVRSIVPDYAYTTGGGSCRSRNSCGVILGNDDLDPEETTNFELGAIYEADSYSVSATAFHTKFKNKLQQRIAEDAAGNPVTWDGPQYRGDDGLLHDYIVYQNFNVDEATISGVELAGDWSITSDLEMRASYTYTKSKQKTGDFRDFPLARTPEHMASLRFDWMTPVTGLDAWLSANYHGTEIASGLRIGTNGSPITINGVEGRKYGAYTTVDLGANYQINDRARLNAAVYNVLNEEINETEFNTIKEGRRLWLGLTAEF
ncbi:TonB-dependent receptor domain-containing protein [Paracoccus shanxieyensis]|nr:TonB-dependent receptor [Paracoccus shanxieyensis]